MCSVNQVVNVEVNSSAICTVATAFSNFLHKVSYWSITGNSLPRVQRTLDLESEIIAMSLEQSIMLLLMQLHSIPSTIIMPLAPSALFHPRELLL